MSWPWPRPTNATIVGGEYKHYAFFVDGRRLHVKEYLPFANDDAAEDYARRMWPAHYRDGIEMRCCDQEG